MFRWCSQSSRPFQTTVMIATSHNCLVIHQDNREIPTRILLMLSKRMLCKWPHFYPNRDSRQVHNAYFTSKKNALSTYRLHLLLCDCRRQVSEKDGQCFVKIFWLWLVAVFTVDIWCAWNCIRVTGPRHGWLHIRCRLVRPRRQWLIIYHKAADLKFYLTKMVTIKQSAQTFEKRIW